MIRLLLQMFGGGGSKSGTGATNAASSSGASHHGSAGGRTMDNLGKVVAETTKRKTDNVGNAVTAISPKEKYKIYDNSGKAIGTQSGKDLLDSINNRGFHYNKTIEKWVGKSGKKYTIRIIRR